MKYETTGSSHVGWMMSAIAASSAFAAGAGYVNFWYLRPIQRFPESVASDVVHQNADQELIKSPDLKNRSEKE